MREIKFRAYIKDEGRLLNVNLIDFDDEYVRVWDEHELNEEEWYFKHCEIMQYTGLKDVNGVEIYEGDIVEVKYSGNDDYKGNAQVVFKNGSFELVGKIMDMINQEAIMYDDFYTYTNELGRYSSSCAVIGNKFENPELLEETE